MFFLSLAAFFPSPSYGSDPLITEVQSSNRYTITDEDDDSPDWIEIHNPGAESIDLSAFALTDNDEVPGKWPFPKRTLEPGEYLLVFASGKNRVIPDQELHTNFKLRSGGEYLALVRLATMETVKFFEVPALEPDQSYAVDSEGNYTVANHATPGDTNKTSAARIVRVRPRRAMAIVGEDLAIEAEIATDSDAVDGVWLHNAVMFRNPARTAMKDDGVAPDTTANDGIFTASIPHRTLFGELFHPGIMVRWYVTVTAGDETADRRPAFLHTEAEEYYGTIVSDPGLDTSLPVVHRFVENESAVDTGSGTRGAVYYEGEFYDNVFMRIRGDTGRSWPKKSYKMEFPGDHHLLFDPELPRVDEFNLNTTYTDKSYARAVMMTRLHMDSGHPSPISFPVRVQQNGEFFSVAIFVEQPDSDFLRRNGLDPDGAFYKGVAGSYLRNTNGLEKKTRLYENNDDVREFVEGIRRNAAGREEYLFDHVNLPAQINFMAAIIIAQNIDATNKNYYLYRDTEGSGEWFMTPWDLDLSFGPDALNTDYILADANTAGAANGNARHPYLGSYAWPLHADKTNELMDAIIVSTRGSDMLKRRIRTLMDQFLNTTYFEDMLDELETAQAADVLLDRERWKNAVSFPGRRDTMQQTMERIRTEYLAPRRVYLESGGEVKIPGPQPDMPSVTIARVESLPDSGNIDEQFVMLQNSDGSTLDISGWRLTGGIEFEFPPGTVLAVGTLFVPDNGKLYVAKDSVALRAREKSPKAGEANFVVGNYSGTLWPGEVVSLTDASGEIIDSFTVPNDSLLAGKLQLSEVMYHPVDNAPLEYVELLNSSSEPVSLAGLAFTAGIVFSIGRDEEVTLDAGERAVIVQDQAAFVAEYGGAPRVLGEFAEESRLDNSGDRLRAEDNGGVTFNVNYGDGERWPAEADGQGHSLVVSGDPDTAAGWRASVESGGNPGDSDTLGYPGGDANEDPDGDGVSRLWEYAAGTEEGTIDGVELLRLTRDEERAWQVWVRNRRGADDVEYVFSRSEDLSSWADFTDQVVYRGRRKSEDGLSDWMTFEMPGVAGGLFVRAEAMVRE